MSIVDDFSTLKFDDEGETTLLEHTTHFLDFCTEHDIHYEDVACRLFILTFEGHVRKWCHAFTDASMDSFKHLVTKLFRAFDMYDRKHLCKKILEL